MIAMPEYYLAKDHADWLEIRKKGLGGSDIGTALGFNPFKTPYQLWLEKTGQVEPEDISQKVAIQIGNELEDLVARMFTQETGLEVQRDNKTHVHKEYPFLLANIDRKIIGQEALLECKTTGAHNAGQWAGDNVPASYLLQVQHYLNVLDYDTAYIAVIIGNNDFQWKEIKRDNDLIQAYQEKAISFWQDNVLAMKAPEIDGSASTSRALSAMYTNIEPNVEPMPKDKVAMVQDLIFTKDVIKQYEEKRRKIENELKAYMGANNVQELTNPDMTVTWKPRTARRLDTNRLKQEHPEIYKAYLTETTTNYMTAKELTKDGD